MDSYHRNAAPSWPDSFDSGNGTGMDRKGKYVRRQTQGRKKEEANIPGTSKSTRGVYKSIPIMDNKEI